MSDQVGNENVGFLTTRLICFLFYRNDGLEGVQLHMHDFFFTYCTMFSDMASIFEMYKGSVTHEKKMGSVLFTLG